MPGELPNQLPPKLDIDHAIELVPGIVLSKQASYCMPLVHLEKLKRQLKQLVDGGLLRPSKAPYDALVLFQRKKDGTLRIYVDYHTLYR